MAGLLAAYANEWMRRKWLENGIGYNVYVHFTYISFSFHSFISNSSIYSVQQQQLHKN